MCGLVGMAGKVSISHKKMFRNMLIFDQIRGIDSTGIAFVDKYNGSVDVEKEVGGASQLWDWGESKLLDYTGQFRIPPMVAIGHNRAATIGKVQKDTAHPFTFKHITGAHNGTLWDWDDLEGADEFDVDSQALYNDIAEKGIDHTWGTFRGAAALTWWDDDKETINLIRNSERPLYVAFEKGGDTLFWASEEWMITIAAKKAKINLEMAPVMLKENYLHSYKPTKTSIKIEENRELKKKLANTYTTNTGRGITKNTVGFKTGKVKSSKINLGWASDTYKAEKGDKGQEARFLRLVTYYPHVSSKKYQFAVLERDDGERVEVYPQNQREWERWESFEKAQDVELFFKITHRPRVRLDNRGKIVCYLICSSGVKFVKSLVQKQTRVQTPPQLNTVEAKEEDLECKHNTFDRLVSEKRFKQILDNLSPKCSCSICMNPLDLQDHKDFLWVGPTTVACPDCASSSTLTDLLQTIPIH